MIDSIDTRIRQCLGSADRFLVTAHIRPDGDAIGSVLGMGLALLQAGKEVQMVLADGLPSSFKHLPGSQYIKKNIDQDYDLSILLDCSDKQRSGTILGDRIPDINIDHHITNDNFAKINLVDEYAASTTVILTKHLPLWGFTIDQDIADVLLTGLITDTIGFRTSNVTPETLRLAAGLLEIGSDISELYEKALTSRSFQAARYWGQGLQSLQKENRLVWTVLTLEDRKTASYLGNDDADLVNILSSIDNTDIAIIFIEQNNNHVKVSWRARPGWDVSKLAMEFGGGGHPAAAGADIPGDLFSVQEKVLQTTKELMKSRNNLCQSDIRNGKNGISKSKDKPPL